MTVPPAIRRKRRRELTLICSLAVMLGAVLAVGASAPLWLMPFKMAGKPIVFAERN